MNNRNILIGTGVLIAGYLIYNQNQKKKLQSTPYTDSELQKVINEFTSKEVAKSVEINKSSAKDAEEVKAQLLDLIQRAKTNGKDISRANIDKILIILRKIGRNESGDNSAGIVTNEEQIIFDNFRVKKPI